MVESDEETTSVGADGVHIQNEKPPEARGTTERGDGEDIITLVKGLQVGLDCHVAGLSGCRLELFDFSVFSYCPVVAYYVMMVMHSV